MTSTIDNKSVNSYNYPNRMGFIWTKEEENDLLKLVSQGKTHEEIALNFERTKGGILSRLKDIALKLNNNNVDMKEIEKITGLNALTISEHINKKNKYEQNRKKKEELINNNQTDIMEFKLVLYQIRDSLREMIKNQRKIMELEGI